MLLTYLVGGALLCLTASSRIAAQQYRFDSWTTDDGLSQNSVYSIVQMPDGYIWLTTLDGLVRFDGVKFTVFNKSNSPGLTSNRMISLFAENDNTLWIGTEGGGLLRFRDGIFRAFSAADGLPSSQVNKIFKDSGRNLIVVMRNGSARFDGARFVAEESIDSRDYALYFAPSGTSWRLDKSGLRATRDGRTTGYDLPFALERIAVGRTFNYPTFVQMLEDRRTPGVLWLTAAGNLYRLEDGRFTTFTRQDGMPANLVWALAQDAAGDIWLGTDGGGLCRFADNRVACYTTRNGLSSERVRSLLIDRENTLWATTEDRGFNRVTRPAVTPLSKKEGLADGNIYPLLEDRRGDVWIGSASALSLYRGGSITNYTRQDGLLYEIVQSLAEDRGGRLWIGSIGGIEHFDGNSFTDFTERLGLRIGDTDFYDIHQTRDGAMWFATNKGLLRYRDGVVTKFTTEDGLPSNEVRVIHETTDSGLWFGTLGGLAKYDGQQFGVFDEKNGLTGNHVRAIYEDAQGLLWVGTYDSGLSLLRDGKITNITTANGLFSNGVFAIMPNGSGNFWMSSNQGIYRVSRQQLIDFADGKRASVVSTAFGKSDGMLNSECNGGRQPAAIKTADGRLWFPTQEGVAIVSPETIAVNSLPPPVVIETVRLENRTLDHLQSGVEMQPGQDHLEIDYTGLSFIKPEQIRFRYKLEGLDKDWTEAGGRRTAYLSYLPPGSYAFRVTAANSDNVWNERGATFSFVVLPPFYWTWWFTLFVVMSIIAATYLAFRYRVAQLHRRHGQQQDFLRRLIESQEAERKRIAAELHDSLGQTLLVIKNRAFMGARAGANGGATSRQLEAANEQFDEIAAAAAEAINEAREISYHLRPSQLERLGLTASIKEMIEHVAGTSGIHFDYDIAPLDGVFPPESEINVYRIAQESLNNVVKHSGASRVNVSIRHDKSGVELTIRDDGRGFEPTPTRGDGSGMTSFGLTSIAERARLLGGSHVVESTPGRGTTITVSIPPEL